MKLNRPHTNFWQVTSSDMHNNDMDDNQNLSFVFFSHVVNFSGTKDDFSKEISDYNVDPS